MRIEVIRPAMLLRKFGLPQAMICRIILMRNCGRQKRSIAFLRRKGRKAMTAQSIIAEQVASAAAQMPQWNTPRKRNSRMAHRADIRIFSHMLPRTYPQMRR